MEPAYDPDLRLPDGGPVYAETLPLDALPGRLVAEPVNTLTAALFLALAVWGWWRLSRSGRRDAFMTWALPVLALGGLGGTLYHGTRASRVWLLLDVIPIVALIIGSSALLWRRVLGRWWWSAFLVALAPVAAARLAISGGALPGNVAALIGYTAFASLVVVPMLVVLRAGAWVGWGLVAGACGCFALAIACRTADPYLVGWAPFHGHVLWHLLGLAACHCLIAYLARSQSPGGRRRAASPVTA